MTKLSFPLLISLGGSQLARVIDRIFASLLPVGSLSALAFAHRLTGLQFDFLVRPLQRSTFPHFTTLIADGHFPVLSRQLFHYLRVVFFIIVPVSVGLMAVPDIIVRLLFGRGAFDETSVRLTSQAVFFYAMGLPAQTLSTILDRTFFSLKDTRTPTKASLLRIGAKIVLAYILIKPLAHAGIALAESASQVIKVFILFLWLPQNVKGQERRGTLGSFSRTLIVSAFTGVVIYFVAMRISGLFNPALELAGLLLLGSMTYGIAALLFQKDEVRTLVTSVAALRAKHAPNGSQKPV